MPSLNFLDEGDSEEYFDDELSEFSESEPRKRSLNFISKSIFSIIGVALFFTIGSTYAGSIRINPSGNIEYGQGKAVATACSSGTTLTLTPRANLINAAGNGAAFYFNAVSVSNIPVGCSGVDFEISAYGPSSSSPLAIFNSTATKAIVYNNSGTFSAGYKTSGVNVSSGSGSFTITFSTPVALSSDVAKITLQSTSHTPWPCGDGGPCSLGETGPAGGLVFYVNPTGFNCGSSFTSTGSPSGGQCHYMEFAPYNWSTLGSDPNLNWAVDAYKATAVPGLTLDAAWSLGAGNAVTNASLASVIGRGYQQTNLIVSQNGSCANSASCTYAAGSAKAYSSTVSGTTYTDWYLGNIGELNQLCKYATAQTGTADTLKCSGGTYTNSPFYGSGTILTAQSAGGFTDTYYSSSDQSGATANFRYDFRGGSVLANFQKNDLQCAVRPIRAF